MSERPTAWWAPWAVPMLGEPVRDALVRVEDGRIAELAGGVTREDAVAAGAEAFDDCVIAPGLINAHSHIEYAAYDGITDALPFDEWIDDHVQRKQRLRPAHMLASAQLGAWQAAAGGITYVADASFSGDAARALHDVGLRGRVYLEVFGTGDEAAVVERCLARLGELPQSPLLAYGISPHAPYSVSLALYRAVAETGLPWMTHLLETAAEAGAVRDGIGPLADFQRTRGREPVPWGSDPIEALAPLLGPHVVAVHAVHATDRDLELLAQSGAAVAHCPRSNARLGCGVLDLARFERAGAALALGTDSPASAGPIDMFAELRSAIELHRAAASNARYPDAQRVLRMATVDAAQALGHDDLGVIAPGAHADLLVAQVGPTADPVTALVLTGSPARVQATMVAGNVVWRHDRNDLQQAHSRAADTRALLNLPVRQLSRTR